VVLGAGLYAANLSTTFKLRKFRMSDGATYPVVFQVCAKHPCQASVLTSAAVTTSAAISRDKLREACFQLWSA